MKLQEHCPSYSTKEEKGLGKDTNASTCKRFPYKTCLLRTTQRSTVKPLVHSGYVTYGTTDTHGSAQSKTEGDPSQ